MIDCVLDASALLALLADEPGSERVAKALPFAAMSSVNLAEVVGKLVDRQMPADLARNTIEGLDIDVRPFDLDQAYAAGALRTQTAIHGLSLGDRACLALAQYLSVPALTADTVWQRLNIADVHIELIR